MGILIKWIYIDPKQVKTDKTTGSVQIGSAAVYLFHSYTFMGSSIKYWTIPVKCLSCFQDTNPHFQLLPVICME